jgi:hypothetical protein
MAVIFMACCSVELADGQEKTAANPPPRDAPNDAAPAPGFEHSSQLRRPALFEPFDPIAACINASQIVHDLSIGVYDATLLTTSADGGSRVDRIVFAPA